MAVHFHKLAIKEIKKETEDCVSVLFDVPDALKADFQFRPGQSLSMRLTIDGEEIRRTYSICSSPAEEELKVAIKKTGGGVFSSYANEHLKNGDILEVMPPVGSFFVSPDPLHQKNYTAFAAGSGITPVLSIIKTILATEPYSSFTLVYGNKNRSSIIFFEELEGLKDKYLDRFNLIHLLSREQTDTAIHHGRISKEKCTQLYSKLLDLSSTDDFFICGPEEMIFTVRDFLTAHGIDEKKIHFELFTTPGQSKKHEIKTLAPEVSSQQSKITARLDGRSIDFELPLHSESTLLEALIAQGADVPYSCKGGVCCTCKARLLEGEVTMDVHWGLEQEEIDQGYILTCQSHPATTKIIIDFDVK